jgi:predicted nucleic acid-binding protein
MIHGLDTGFWVAAELIEHPDHFQAESTWTRLVASGDQIAIAPQVIDEFLHIVTDPRRFVVPLTVPIARQRAEVWWTASEAVHVFPNAAAVDRFFAWLAQFGLGRKRLLDTMLAATYLEAGIRSILTTNPQDFAVFGVFTCVTPGS